MLCRVLPFPFTQPSHASFGVLWRPRPLPISSVACRDERSHGMLHTLCVLCFLRFWPGSRQRLLIFGPCVLCFCRFDMVWLWYSDPLSLSSALTITVHSRFVWISKPYRCQPKRKNNARMNQPWWIVFHSSKPWPSLACFAEPQRRALRELEIHDKMKKGTPRTSTWNNVPQRSTWRQGGQERKMWHCDPE